MRDTARAPQPPFNQPKRHQISQEGLYVLKKAYSGSKMAVLGQTALLCWEGAEVLIPTYQKTTEAPCSHCFIDWAWHQKDHIGQYLAQNDHKCIFWAKFGLLWAKNLTFYGRKQKFWYPCNEKCQIWAKFGYFWAKNPFF